MGGINFVVYTNWSINDFVPFLINTFDTIVRGGERADFVVTASCGYLLHGAGKYCILLML